MRSLNPLRCFALAGVVALSACSDGPTAPQSTPADLNRAADFTGWWFNDHDDNSRQPDWRFIATFTSKPAPPDPLHDHALIGPEGGSLRVGDFEIVVPPGAVEKATLFQIKVPVDPRAAEHAYAEFKPHMVFKQPVTIRLPRTSTTAANAPWVLWWADWFWLPMPTVITPDGRIETRTWHFSFYGTSIWERGVTTMGG